VLSFPALDESRNGFAGDIAISLEIATVNARRFGHAPAEEVKILALHGILHLAGYDHERDNGKMAVKEARLRRVLGLPQGLIERNHSSSRDRKRARSVNVPRRPSAKKTGFERQRARASR
jgi:probable rRNA maturation factor